jgi:hypothetical protein
MKYQRRKPKLSSNSAVLENTETVIHNVHDPSECAKEFCTIHNRSNHHMRSLPQQWREELGIMERTCSHGVGHPDPDEFMLSKEIYIEIHGCDGCCDAPTKLIVRRDLRNLGR